MTKVLEISDLNYKKGKSSILHDINLSLDQGKIIGLLGANGAGKTSLMRLIDGINAKTSGKITVACLENKAAIKACVSMTDHLDGFKSIYSNMIDRIKAKNVIEFYLDVYPDFSFPKYQAIADYLNIDSNQKLSAMSKGVRAKFIIALTLAREVPLYLLDEPLDGIDIMTRKKIIKSILQWKNDESTIIISDHYVSEITSLLDDVVIIKDQTIYEVSSVEDIQTKYHMGLEEYYEKVYEGEITDD